MMEYRPIELIGFAFLIFAAGFVAAEAAAVLGMVKSHAAMNAALEGDDD